MSQAWIVALSACLAFAACGPSESKAPAAVAKAAVDEQLEALVPELVDAIQAKQPVFVMDHVGEAFKDERGLDYFGVRSVVESYAFRDEEVGARLESVAITPIEADKQRVVARVAFALGQRIAADKALPPGAVTYAFDLVFEKHDARWRAVAGSYRRE